MIEESPAIRLLNQAIQLYPDAPVNYLLRAEEWLARGFDEKARDDFLSARTLAEELLNQSAWGYLYQAYIDRATTALNNLAYIESGSGAL